MGDIVVLSSIGRALLVSAVCVTGWVAVPGPTGASEVQLHQLLFNRTRNAERERQIRQPRRQRAQTRQTTQGQTYTAQETPAASQPKIQRVSGPRYYAYAAPRMAGVTLVSLLPDVTATGSIGQPDQALPPLPVLEHDRFKQALDFAPDSRLSLEPEVIKVVRAHYAENPAFLWVDGMNVNADGRAIALRLADAGDHGLDPLHYAVRVPADGWSPDDPAARYRELLEFEVTLTARAIRFAMDMKDGVIDPNRISGYHDFSKQRLKPDAAMAGLSAATDPAGWLDRLVPRQPEYAKLQDALAELRQGPGDEIVIPDGTFMRPGMVSDALPMIIKAAERKMSAETRAKHASILAAYSGTTLYDGALVELLRDVQRDLNLVPDGIVGPKTVARLDGASRETKIERIELALERLRWHPEDYGRRQVVINQPEYRVRYLENGEATLSMRAIVGKTSNQTYFFHDEIEHVVYDPYWGVPQSIIVNEMLPKLWRDPSYLDRNGYVVTSHGGTQIASSAINWQQFAGKVPYNVRQKPGPRNALGELKIMFPNSHAIYMHDTPAKNLFGRDSRAFSHGCVRLEDPRAMAAAVLGKSREHVASQLGGYEQVEQLTEKVPVYVAYFTAWPSDEGVVDFHPDVYERDKYLRRAVDTVGKARAG